MTTHRHPQDSVSNDVHPDNPEPFNAAEALQSLHLEVVQLEALANAANEAVVQLPFPAGREARRPFDRVYALVSKVADETNAVVNHGGQLMDALAAYLQRKQADA
jgi:predicted amidophosphoribosyltransferase